MPSVREALEKISELESRKAILETLLAHLETHYTSSDAGDPDMRITRDDHGLVPEHHITTQIDLLVVEVDQVKKELEGWKGLSINPPDEEEDVAKKVRKKRRRGSASASANQPDADPGEQGGTGQAA